MYLKEITIKGFKSFAEKTTLEFSSPDSSGKLPLTAVVGPNGSGKSNIADAVRWVLGEQSVKAVRGKKSKDVIFTGSTRRSRSAMADVQLTVVNDNGRIALDTPEVTIARRLYRDGQSDYLLNNKVSRLMDIQMLLAKAAFGKEGYSVIAQGQIDHILTASAEERKTFFDEATGVRPLQIKKEHSLKKLSATEENLRQALLLQDEIAPRLRSLTRQVRRLERREVVEKDLHELQTKYYGTLLQQIEKEYEKWNGETAKTEEQKSKKIEVLKKIEQEMKSLEKEQSKPVELLNIQTEYQKLTNAKEKLRDQEFELKRKLLSSKKQASAVPTHEIVQILSAMRTEMKGLVDSFDLPKFKSVFSSLSSLVDRLKGESTPEQAAGITKELEKITKELGEIDQELEKLKSELQEVGQSAEQKKQSFFEVQRRLSAKQTEIHSLESELSLAKIEMAKIETRRDDLKNEAKQEMQKRYEQATDYQLETADDPSDLLPEIQKLKRQLELIGGVDEETIKEYKEVKERHDFLKGQIDDLEGSLQSLVTLLEELDQTIRSQFEQSFHKINEEFENYFKILFGGGTARLSKLIVKEANRKSQIAESDEENEEENTLSEQPSLLERFTKKDSYRGVEIHATPPGKKLKSIAMLSGGERALTSIALLSAILSLNPPPFVILDEVDAALDESNSARFATILTELANTTQFIVITHNRATMQASEILYGVTMGDDGVSKILSLKFEEAEKTVRGG